MDFDSKLKLYAELLITHGLNVQDGQVVNISTEAYHRDFAILCAEAAYAKGAKYVNIDLADNRLLKLQIEKSKEEDLSYVPEYLPVKYKELVDSNGANLKIIGPEEPELLSDLNPKRMNLRQMKTKLAVKYFYDEGIGKSKVHWTVAAAATPGWGKRIFPDKSPQEAEMLLWEEIFKICRADKENCIALWKEHNSALQKRAEKLDQLKIKELHFKGPGTELTVGLSEHAIFKGGTDVSPRGVPFEPNIPTEECFTTPDWRMTNGFARATRPFLINGKLVKGLSMTFKEGLITDFSAEEGEDTFREYISSDEGARRLGEVALVGVDSPIFKSGHVFEEILFDENAACHIAVGSAYKFCIRGGDKLTTEQAEAIGCNESCVHTDMMISSPEVDVIATTYSGKTVEIIKNGNWIDF